MSQLQSTNNKYGSMFPLNQYKRDFITYAANVNTPVIDVGAAFGITTLPLIELGATVVAIDLDENELQTIYKQTPSEQHKQLILKHGQFPE